MKLIINTFIAASACLLLVQPATAAKPVAKTKWDTVVNNNDQMPGAPGGRTFNSYNQPSVNVHGLVVMRARSRGGPPAGPPTHGIYTRDMSGKANPIVRILDRTTEVPHPNNLGTTFVETPSFPRIDMDSPTIATRGNHPPVWNYVPEVESEVTRAGTTGIYTNPFGDLITGASKLGAVPEFSFFEVPAESPGTLFEVFPGAPAVTGGSTIVFKGNYTVKDSGKTGVYFRELQERPIGDDDLEPAGGDSPVVLIANNSSTLIPGTDTFFGSTSPPSAANGQAVFAGFDDEEKPTEGGIYLAPLEATPELTTLVGIGERVPGESASDRFNGLGEGNAFDGRFVGFWGAWGAETRTIRLYCPTEGNQDRIDYCNRELVCADHSIEEDKNSTCEGEDGERKCYQEREVSVNQGVFVHDTKTQQTHMVAKTGDEFDEFLYWNYSGKVPCVGVGHHGEEGDEEDGEPARWRSSAFVAVSSRGAAVWSAFKARTGELGEDKTYVDPVDGIYLLKTPGNSPMVTLADTTMAGQALDPEAPAASVVTAVGIESEGFRGQWLVINASMEEVGGEEDDGMAGIYITRLP